MTGTINNIGYTKSLIGLSISVFFTVSPLALFAQTERFADRSDVDTSEWSCQFCPDVSGWSGDVSLGGYQVSDDSFKFGDYTGLNEKGGYLLASGAVQFNGDDGYYMDVIFDELGLDSRSVNLEGGRQGVYQYSLLYDQLPHYLYDTALTPFSGTHNLVLPSGWVDSGTTGGMSNLNASLQNIDIQQERKTIGAGFKYTQSSRWEYAAEFSQSTQTGNEVIGASFINTSSLLPSPVDYTTDQGELTASYTGKKLQAQFGYYASIFSNKNNALNWQNPFTPIATDGNVGQLALAPDNSFHQVSASATYRLGVSARLVANIALGHMQQDDDYLPSTINSSLTTSALPQSSLNGEVDTLTYNLRLNIRPEPRASLNFALQYSERDNSTAQNDYEQVDTDVFVSTTRTNVPYSFNRRKAKMDLTYRLPYDVSIATGVDIGSFERSLYGSSKTDEDNIWGEIKADLFDMVDVRLRLANESKRHRRIDWLTVFVTEENPYLQKFNMADRDRDEVSFTASISPVSMLNIGITVDYTDDDYFNSWIGLTDSEQTNYTLDLSLAPTNNMSIYLFASQEEIESRMAGSSDFSGFNAYWPNWAARQRDTIDTVGLGFDIRELFDRFDIGVNYNSSDSKGKIDLIPLPVQAFPDLVTDYESVNLYLKYKLNETFGLRFSYLTESYDSNDWGFDNVEPDTVPSILTLGQDSFVYDVDVFSLAVDYRF